MNEIEIVNPGGFLGKAERQIINRRAHQLAVQATQQVFACYRLQLMQAAAARKQATGGPVTNEALERIEPKLADVLRHVAAGAEQ
jgi:hypothetical protein